MLFLIVYISVHMNQVWLPRTGTIRATNKRSMTELIKKKKFRKYRCRNQILQSSNTEVKDNFEAIAYVNIA